MHADGATRVIVDYAAKHRIPFAVVPCCSDNSMSYKPWVKFLVERAKQVLERASAVRARTRG